MATIAPHRTVVEESCTFCTTMDAHTAGKRHVAPELSCNLVGLHCVDCNRIWFRPNVTHTTWKPACTRIARQLFRRYGNSHQIKRYGGHRRTLPVAQDKVISMGQDSPKVTPITSTAVA